MFPLYIKVVNVNRSAGSFYFEISKVTQTLEIIHLIGHISPLPLRIRQRQRIVNAIAHFQFGYPIGPNLESQWFSLRCSNRQAQFCFPLPLP